MLPINLPKRRGERPQTTKFNPHTQLDQQPTDPELREEIAKRVFALPHVEERPSRISVPGARGLFLRDDVAEVDERAFMIEREFAHLHPHEDHSLHVRLPVELGDVAIVAGWAEAHPRYTDPSLPYRQVMLYAPRDREELQVIEDLVRASYEFACGRGAG